MRHPRLHIAIATLVAILVVAACGPAATPGPSAAGSPAASSAAASAPAASAASAPTKLEFWGGWTGPDGDVMRKLVDQYNASHPSVQVTLTTQQWTPLFDKFLLGVKSGNQPDLLAMHPPDVPQFAALGLLQDVGATIKTQGFSAGDFAAPAWNGTFYQNVQYAYPLDLHMHAVYYNADLLAKAGLTPPTDWISGDAFVKLATALTVDKGGKHPGDSGFDPSAILQYGLSLPNNHHGFFMWYALLNGQGDHLLDAGQQKLDFPDADGASAWQWLQDLVFKYSVTPTGQTSQLQDFLTGKTAMLIDGPWQIPAMEKQAGLRWGTFPFPQAFAKKAVWGSGHSLTVPKQQDAKRTQAAKDLAQWIVQNSAAWGGSGNLPALNTARENAAFKALPGRAGFLASLPYEVMLPGIPRTAQVFSAAATSPIVVASQSILVQGKPVAASQATMRQSMGAVLAAP